MLTATAYRATVEGAGVTYLSPVHLPDRDYNRLEVAFPELHRLPNAEVLARYAFDLATAFSDFYEHTPPLYRETDPAMRRFRIRLVEAFRQTFRNTLLLLGIPPLEAI